MSRRTQNQCSRHPHSPLDCNRNGHIRSSRRWKRLHRNLLSRWRNHHRSLAHYQNHRRCRWDRHNRRGRSCRFRSSRNNCPRHIGNVRRRHPSRTMHSRRQKNRAHPQNVRCRELSHHRCCRHSRKNGSEGREEKCHCRAPSRGILRRSAYRRRSKLRRCRSEKAVRVERSAEIHRHESAGRRMMEASSCGKERSSQSFVALSEDGSGRVGELKYSGGLYAEVAWGDSLP